MRDLPKDLNMYNPAHFKEDDQDIAYDLIDKNGFAVMVSTQPSLEVDYPTISHIPLLRDGDVLLGHVARVNKHWKLFDGQTHKITAIFQGPHGYISPRWYVSKNTVPTWLYSTVHVVGIPEILTKADDVAMVMDKISAQYEGANGWKPSDNDKKTIDALSRGIVCFRIPISELHCKLKLNQHKPEEDQKSVIGALKKTQNPENLALVKSLEALSK